MVTSNHVAATATMLPVSGNIVADGQSAATMLPHRQQCCRTVRDFTLNLTFEKIVPRICPSHFLRHLGGLFRLALAEFRNFERKWVQ